MNHQKRSTVAISLFFLLVGCGAQRSPSMASVPHTMAKMDLEKAKGAPGEAWMVSAHISLTVESVETTLSGLEKTLGNHSGSITRIERQGRGNREDVNLTVRLTPDGLSPTMAWLRQQGVVNHENIEREEVGRRLFESRIALKTARSTLARLEKLLEKPDIGVKEILSIEKEMTRLRREIEVLEGTDRHLKDRVAKATLQVKLTHRPVLRTDPNAKLYLSGRANLLLHGQNQTEGFGITLHAPDGPADFHLDADFFPGKKAEPDRFLMTMGGSSYSDFFGRGERQFINPYLGFRLGYANFDAHRFVFGAELGFELFKHRYVLVDARVQGLAVVGGDELQWVGIAGVGVGTVY